MNGCDVTDNRKAVVLLSGGLDSATALAIAQRDGFEAHAITFSYGQRHAVEIECARRLAERAGVRRHVFSTFDLREFGGSALTDSIDVPKDRPASASDIPVTYVPARNTVFLSFALAFAESIGSLDIFVGVNAVDYSGYPDCRPEYIEAFERMANLATKAGVSGESRFKIHAPLIRLTKAQIVRVGQDLGVDFGFTSSCYDPSDVGEACGRCDSCLIRLRAFSECNLADPGRYRYA